MHEGLSPPCLSHEHSLVLDSSWSESLWADREMLLKGGHNPPKSLKGCTPDPMPLKRNQFLRL